MVEEEANAREWTGCGMPERPEPEIPERPVQRVIWLRCPKCLGHLDEVTDFGKGQEGMFYDCPRCAIRLKMWEYHKGMK